MSGIYLHIPYCKKACFYCNFHFSTNKRDIDKMAISICKEIEIKHNYLSNNQLDTLYFGGGTPSLLSKNHFELIFEKLNKYYIIKPESEKTIEVNPDDCTIENLKLWSNLGFNRLSIGIQSFYDEDLKYMNRAHRGNESFLSINNAVEVGFKNISLDLIYGFPLLSDEKWLYNLSRLKDFNISHISCYALTVEQGTPLERMIMSGKAINTKDDHQSKHFDLLQNWAASNNWEHYEISNFAKDGNYSKHNTSYWQGKHYLGLGPAAHSFNGSSRSWNISDNAEYIRLVDLNKEFCSTENLSEYSKLNEYILTGLRTKWGIEINKAENYISNWKSINKKSIEKYMKLEMLEERTGFLFLTNNGKNFADGIASELFVVE